MLGLACESQHAPRARPTPTRSLLRRAFAEGHMGECQGAAGALCSRISKSKFGPTLLQCPRHIAANPSPLGTLGGRGDNLERVVSSAVEHWKGRAAKRSGPLRPFTRQGSLVRSQYYPPDSWCVDHRRQRAYAAMRKPFSVLSFIFLAPALLLSLFAHAVSLRGFARILQSAAASTPKPRRLRGQKSADIVASRAFAPSTFSTSLTTGRRHMFAVHMAVHMAVPDMVPRRGCPSLASR